MLGDSDRYQPISCEFHDLLEALSTLRKLVQIDFRDREGALQRRSATVADVFARDGSEYLLLSTGETLRLDRILAVVDATVD